MREGFLSFVQVIPIFAIVAYFSTLEKALIASTVVWSIWVAVSSRKEGWGRPSFWLIVTTVAVANVVAIWAVPITGRFEAGLAIVYPLGMVEGFATYWLLGWWLRRQGAVCFQGR